jgi:hypothetical protein
LRSANILGVLPAAFIGLISVDLTDLCAGRLSPSEIRLNSPLRHGGGQRFMQPQIIVDPVLLPGSAEKKTSARAATPARLIKRLV